MKKIILVLIVFSFAGQSWGQEKKKEEKRCSDSLSQYYVLTEVKIIDNTIKVKGFTQVKGKDKYSFKTECKLINYGYVFTNITSGYNKLSLITIPIKIRPKTAISPANVDSGLDNLGINYEIAYRQWDKYFATGRNSTHRIGGGIIIAPLIQELTKDNTKSNMGSNKQFFLSAGLGLNYSYNKILFTIVPVGFDFALNQAGRDWINNGKYWWGFGIGADLKIIEKVIDK